MLRLLVVDDEKYDRDSIISMINSDFKEQLEISEAKNGREAIEISERLRPEIIIMDIKMPGINGLKAIQEIRKFLPNSYFIILTAYDYFDFAVEAVKNNVKEYILKPFSRIEIMEKIEVAVNYINTEKMKRKNEIENQEKLYNLMPVIENELSFAIINNSIYSIDYETYCRYLSMDFENAYSMVVNIKHKANDEYMEDAAREVVKLQIGEYIKEYISRRHRNIPSYRFTKELVYFIQIQNNEEEEESNLNSVNLAADIRREVKRLFNISVMIGIGRCYNGLNQMHKSYEEAKSALYYESENMNIIHINDVYNNSNDKRYLNEKVNNGDREKIALFKAVEQYIKDNIKVELDLEKTAAKFNLSIYYFSRIFKDILGYNFPDYINKVRIDMAKELLKNDSISIKEICYSVGYSDPNYFSKVFKKYEGLTPSEFKIKLI
jgi:two-component system, response regulator YesN